MGLKAQWNERTRNRFDFQGTHLRWALGGDRPDQGIVVVETASAGNLIEDFVIDANAGRQSTYAGGFQLSELPGRAFSQADTCTRGAELSLRYDERPDRAIEFSTLFRCQAARDSAEGWDELEWVLSMQTSLLDAKPYQFIQGQLPFGEVQLVPSIGCDSNVGQDPGRVRTLGLTSSSPTALVLWERSGCHVIAGYAGDWRGLHLNWDETGLEWQAQLRADHLEKGVIRRLRCLWAFRPQATREQALEKIAQFQASRLPLS